MQRVKHWYRHSLAQPWSKLSTLEKLLSVIIGFLGGVFPVPALTTLVTLVLAKIFSMNAAQITVATAVNLMLTVVEIALIPPFAQISAPFTGADASSFTAGALAEALDVGVVHLLTAASSMVMHAIVAWAVLTVLCVVGLKAMLPKRGHSTKLPK